uniref:caffeic acid 3-O-methyltransferase-like n=1 Tax=Erigeron canadensis TaxID=72917 RepID=UPI001CB8CDE3|nr:caffeic acid 3-O-methyltransferase-like [Erigeron canadensis]
MDKLYEKLPSNDDEQFCRAMQMVTISSLPMVLLTAIKLKVLEVIAEAGPDAQLSANEIASSLSITNPDASVMLDRMLRLLASHSVVTCTKRDHLGEKPVRAYGLTPVAKYFVPNEDGVSLGPMMELVQGEVFIQSWYKLKDCVIEGGIPFNKVHGKHLFEFSSLNGSFNQVFNKAMMHTSFFVIKGILKCYHGFDNLKRLVDVGGGLGVTINMIVSKYPSIKGINYDLPHVIQHAPVYPGIEHVGGDMFKDVPQGDAILLKWILHDWTDDHCLKLLKNCYKALPEDGMVIVVDAVLNFVPDSSVSTKLDMNADAIMMTQDPGGKERTEDEFLSLAKAAGFSGIRKKCLVCSYGVMEFYK